MVLINDELRMMNAERLVSLFSTLLAVTDPILKGVTLSKAL